LALMLVRPRFLVLISSPWSDTHSAALCRRRQRKKCRAAAVGYARCYYRHRRQAQDLPRLLLKFARALFRINFRTISTASVRAAVERIRRPDESQQGGWTLTPLHPKPAGAELRLILLL